MTINKKSANTEKARKRTIPKTAWKAGQSGNPAGRPKDGESWAGVIKAIGEMYPDDIIAFVGKDNDLGRAVAKFPKNVQMKYLVTARVFAALMFEPTSGLWNGLMERAEGKVITPVDLTSAGNAITEIVMNWNLDETSDNKPEPAQIAKTDNPPTEEA